MCWCLLICLIWSCCSFLIFCMMCVVLCVLLSNLVRVSWWLVFGLGICGNICMICFLFGCLVVWCWCFRLMCWLGFVGKFLNCCGVLLCGRLCLICWWFSDVFVFVWLMWVILCCCCGYWFMLGCRCLVFGWKLCGLMVIWNVCLNWVRLILWLVMCFGLVVVFISRSCMIRIGFVWLIGIIWEFVVGLV